MAETEGKLLIFASSRNRRKAEELKSAAEAGHHYTGVVQVSDYRQYQDLLKRGLPEITGVAAVWDGFGTAMSVILAASWISELAITHVPNYDLCSQLSADLKEHRVYVFGAKGVDDNYVEGINTNAFLTGALWKE